MTNWYVRVPNLFASRQEWTGFRKDGVADFLDWQEELLSIISIYHRLRVCLCRSRALEIKYIDMTFSYGPWPVISQLWPHFCNGGTLHWSFLAPSSRDMEKIAQARKALLEKGNEAWRLGISRLHPWHRDLSLKIGQADEMNGSGMGPMFLNRIYMKCYTLW